MRSGLDVRLRLATTDDIYSGDWGAKVADKTATRD